MPPSIVERPESQTRPRAGTARFMCQAEGVPPPRISWLKNGEVVHLNGRIKMYSRYSTAGVALRRCCGRRSSRCIFDFWSFFELVPQQTGDNADHSRGWCHLSVPGGERTRFRPVVGSPYCRHVGGQAQRTQKYPRWDHLELRRLTGLGEAALQCRQSHCLLHPLYESWR